jgi:ABC-type sugar transport system permease subunit
MILNGQILEIPAHLDWSRQVSGLQRTSSMKIARHIGATILSGFLFRPVLFLIMPGLLVLAFALYVNTWMFIHFFTEYSGLAAASRTASSAFAQAYAAHPHTFIFAFLSLMLSIQLIGLGVVALQSQKYFEELFYMGTSIRKALNELGLQAADARRAARDASLED